MTLPTLKQALEQISGPRDANLSYVELHHESQRIAAQALAAHRPSEGEREAIAAWVEAETKRHAAIAAYNARLADERARDKIAPDVAQEYKAMTVAERQEHLLRNAMFLALRHPSPLLVEDNGLSRALLRGSQELPSNAPHDAGKEEL